MIAGLKKKTVSWFCGISRHAVVVYIRVCQEHVIISINKYDEIHTISKSVLNLIHKIIYVMKQSEVQFLDL